MEWLQGIAGLIGAVAALITALVSAARFFRKIGNDRSEQEEAALNRCSWP